MNEIIKNLKMSYLTPIEQKEVEDAFKFLEQYQQLKEDPIINKVFFKKYRVIKKIAEGAFGLIYEGINIITKTPIAIKLEDRFKNNILEEEAYILFSIKGFGIVELLSFGRNKKYNIMIQPLLGVSLYQFFLNCKKMLNLKDICLIGKQCLKRIEWIHKKSIIHRDIKPDNFLFGKKDPNNIYLIDFGLSKKYRSERTKKHIQFTLTKKLTGTARYASVNALKGFETSRRDDMESFIYMILFFILKKLPWQGIKAKTQAQRYRKICLIKENFNIDEYKKIPSEIKKIFKYIKKLKFYDRPDYQRIEKNFNEILKKLDCKKNETFSWIKDPKILSLRKSPDLHVRKNTCQTRLLENIKKTHYAKYSQNLYNSCNAYNTDNNNNTNENEIKKLNNPALDIKTVDVKKKYPIKNKPLIKKSKNGPLKKHSNYQSLKQIKVENNNNNNPEQLCTSRRACLEFTMDEDDNKKSYLNQNNYNETQDQKKIYNKPTKFMNSFHNYFNLNKKKEYNNNSYLPKDNFVGSYNIVSTNETNDRNFSMNKFEIKDYSKIFDKSNIFYKKKTDNFNKIYKKNLSNIYKSKVCSSNNENHLNNLKKNQKKRNLSFAYNINDYSMSKKHDYGMSNNIKYNSIFKKLEL